MSKCHCPDCNNELDRPCCAEVEVEALRKECAVRGHRLQVLREMFREEDWNMACNIYPEMRSWFDDRGFSAGTIFPHAKSSA